MLVIQENIWMDYYLLNLRRPKFVFIYSIDLGLLATQAGSESVEKLETLRGTKRWMPYIQQAFESKKSTIGQTVSFRGTEARAISDRAKSQLKKFGKMPLSQYFIDNHSPILMEMLSSAHALRMSDSLLRLGFLLENPQIRITKSGSVSFRAILTYKKKMMSLKKLLQTTPVMREEIHQIIFSLLNIFVSLWNTVLGNEGIRLETVDLERLPSMASIYEVLLSSGFFGTQGNAILKPLPKGSSISREVAGSFRKSQWYGGYSDNYIEKILEDDLGTQKGEFYLCDSEFALISYINFDKMRDYIEDILITIELLVSSSAALEYLNGFLVEKMIDLEFLNEKVSKGQVKDIPSLRGELYKIETEASKVIDTMNVVNDVINMHRNIRHEFLLRFVERLYNRMGIEDRRNMVSGQVKTLFDVVRAIKESLIFRINEATSSRIRKWMLILAAMTLLVTILFGILALLSYQRAPFLSPDNSTVPVSEGVLIPFSGVQMVENLRGLLKE